MIYDHSPSKDRDTSSDLASDEVLTDAMMSETAAPAPAAPPPHDPLDPISEGLASTTSETIGSLSGPNHVPGETRDEAIEREARETMGEQDHAVAEKPPEKKPLRPRNVKEVFLLMSTELADYLFANTDITLPRSSLKGVALAEANRELKAIDLDAELVGSTLGGLEIAQKDEDIWSEPADHIQCLFVFEEELS